MRRIAAVVRPVLCLLLCPLLWGSLAVTLPLATAVAQSQHVSGKGMHWTPVGGSGPLSSTSGFLVVDSLNVTGGGLDASVCANACFGMNYQQSTVPYYSLDVARSVTLHYNSTTAAVRPIVFADAHISSSSTKTLVEYDLQANYVSSAITFLNGETKLRFSAPSPQTTEVRLAGQFDNRLYPTAVDDFTVTVTAVYSDASTDKLTFTSRYVNLNTNNADGSQLGLGWILGGHQALGTDGQGNVLITNGDGSAGWFKPNGTGTYLTETDGDYSLLTSTGSGSSLVYTRTYPDSSRVQFNNVGQETQVILSVLDTVGYAYNSGKVINIIDPYRTYNNGQNRSRTVLTYDTTGLQYLKSIAEPGPDGTSGAGRVTKVLWASDSTLTGIVDPDGDTTKFVYNSNKLLTQIIDRRGDTTRYAYDSHSWLLDSVIAPTVPIDAGGGSTTNKHPITTLIPWQSLGVPTSSTGSTPATPIATSAVYATIVDPLGRKGTYTVNLDGLPLVVSGPLSQVTTITRDASWTMLPLKTAYPTGGHDTLQFTASTPNLTYSQPAGDSASNYHYGVNGQLDSLWTQGELAWRAFLHSTTALPDSVRSGGTDSLLTKYTYDAQRRVLTMKDVNGHTTTYAYDATFGNVDSVSVPGTLFGVRKFDAFGRDTADFARGATYWVRTQYDTLNRPVKQWHRSVSGDTTVTTYDALFPTRVKTPGGSLYKTTANALGQPTARYDAVDTTKFISYRYDLGGRLTSWTNRRNQRVDVVYDSLDRLIRRSGTNIPTDTFTYASNGRIQTAARGTLSLDSTYLNVSGQPDSIVHRLGGHRYAFLYTYAAYNYGQRVSETMTTNAGITFVNQADAWRPGATTLDSVVVSPGTGAGSIVWTADNEGETTRDSVSAGSPSTPAKVMTYTSLHLLMTEAFANPGWPIHDSLSHEYTLDTLGRLSMDQQYAGISDLAWTFVYDGLGRLVKVLRRTEQNCSVTTDSITGKNYSCQTVTPLSTVDSTGYDVAGNRTLTGSAYTATGNRLLTWPDPAGTVTYTYDADGNMITRTHNSVTDSLFWGATSMLDSVHSGGLRRRYEYNSAGQPVRRSTNGNVDRLWLWNGNQLVAELDSAGTHRRAQYLYHGGTDQVYAIVTDSGGSPLVRYVQQDVQGNVTGVIRGSVLKQFTRYTAWGQINAQLNTLADTNRLGWKGLMYEGDSTRLYFVRNRWYDPVAGRFLNEDPIGIAGGTNLYTFAADDPINGRDPTGLIYYKNNCINHTYFAFTFSSCSLVILSQAIAGSYFGCRPVDAPILSAFNHCAVEAYFSAGNFQRWELLPMQAAYGGYSCGPNGQCSNYYGWTEVDNFPFETNQNTTNDSQYNWLYLDKVSTLSLSSMANHLATQWTGQLYVPGNSNTWACTVTNNLGVTFNNVQANAIGLTNAPLEICPIQYSGYGGTWFSLTQ